MLTAHKNFKDTEGKRAVLADCQLSCIALFSLVSPIVSYSYTGRFKALCLFISLALIGFLGVPQLLPNLDWSSRKTKSFLGIGIVAVATIDNTRAVVAARKQIRERSEIATQQPILGQP